MMHRATNSLAPFSSFSVRRHKAYFFPITFLLLVCSHVTLYASEDQNKWFQSDSDSNIRQLDDGVYWSPVRKPTTLHRYFEPVSFKTGERIRITMQWESDGIRIEDSNKDFQCAHNNPTRQGMGISDDYLSCLAGTGDFRLGFFQAGKRVEGDTCEGNREKQNCSSGDSPTKDFNDYRGFQFRIHPHLSSDYSKSKPRLKEKKSKGEEESHINLNLWSRIKKGENGLMSDECQKIDHCGFSKSSGWGTEPVSWGTDMPFGEARELLVEIYRKSFTQYEVYVTLNGQRSPLLTGRFDDDFAPDKLDTMALTYTNSSRKYDYVKIEKLRINGQDDGGAITQLVSGIKAESGRSYRAVSAVKNGSAIYTDRSYRFTDLGDFSGSTLIATSNDDDRFDGDSFLSFKLSKAARVFVLYDTRASGEPSWFSNFVREGDTVRSNDADYDVYYKDYAAGEVVLGGNQRRSTGARSMYTVLLSELDSEYVQEEEPVSNIEVSNGRDYRLLSPLERDSNIYMDRDYSFRDVGNYEGAYFLQPANNDKNAVSRKFLRLSLTRAADIFVLYDVRADSMPSWLSSWRDTGDRISTNDTSFRVYRRSFDSGTHQFGANRGRETGARSMYSLLLIPK